ncbi:MAG: class II aldolase/adducin family protein [Desulfamplus sp.]|nr:class II aldolase/adducin family protein [Desulfamplus sp.]MBF0411413.1 class II aldolase/adducin family protein [Desulfamplus sp.]
MKLLHEREEIIKYSLKMLKSGLTTGSGGNLSIFNRSEGLIAITPSGIEYPELTPEDIILLDIDGNISSSQDFDYKNYEGYGYSIHSNYSINSNKISDHQSLKPSSEAGFHIALYLNRSDINAVVHTHSPYATTFACLNREIPPVHYLVAFAGSKVPVAPYATFGTKQLAENITSSIGSYNAALLANHGLVAVGNTIHNAFNTAEEIELVARICYQAESIGRPVILPDDEMERVIEKFKSYGSIKK